MEVLIESISFSERERKYYSQEFEQLTSEQLKPVLERELTGQAAASFFRQLKISDTDLSTIWELVCEKRSSLKLYNFMAAMRLCSALKQGKPLTKQSYLTEQNVLARRSKGPPVKANSQTENQKKSVDNELPKADLPGDARKSLEVKLTEEKDKVNKPEELKKDIPSIPLQVSQEVLINKKEFKSSDDSKSASNESSQNKPLSFNPQSNNKAIANPNVNLTDKPKDTEYQFRNNPNSANSEMIEVPLFNEKPEPKSKTDYFQVPSSNLYKNHTSEPKDFQDQLRPEMKKIPEEHKLPSKMFPRVPSFPKNLYDTPLSKIEEENLTSKSSSLESVVTVENPVLITSGWLGSSSYYLYTIVTRISEKIFTVKRRFSDLDWMHNQLVTKFKGFIIPSRPDKKFIKNTDEKFVEERRLQMEKYLNIIAKHPILRTSAAFKIFTQTSNEKFENEKAKAEATEEITEYRSIEDTLDKVFALVQNKFQIIFSQKIVPFSKEMSDIEEKLAKLEAPIQTLSGAFAHWVQNSSETNKLLSSLELCKNFSIILSNFKPLCRVNTQNLTKFSLEIKEEQLRLEGLKEALNSYRFTVEECSKLQTLITRKLGKHKSSSDEDTAARYLSEIQSTQDIIEKYNKKLTEIEENIIKEDSTFDSAKTQHLEQTLKDIIISQNDYHTKELNFWKTV